MPSTIYRIESLGCELRVAAAGSRHVLLSAVAKHNNEAAAPYCIPNEMICGELGRFLRLPIPPVSVVSEINGGPLFASLDFNLLGIPLPPVNVANCIHVFPSLSTGLLLFDIWIANPDRHAENFHVNFTAPPQMNIFDHGHALFGNAAGQGEARLSALHDQLTASSCLVENINADTHFAFWLDRIRATPDFFVEEVCQDALPFGLTTLEATAAILFLKTRRDNLRQLINNHRIAFTAIQNWTLPM